MVLRARACCTRAAPPLAALRAARATTHHRLYSASSPTSDSIMVYYAWHTARVATRTCQRNER